MVVSALVSGGKDSIYSAYLSDTQGRSVDELLVLKPDDPESLLFHTPNLDLVKLQAEAWGKQCRFAPVHGTGETAEIAGLRAALEGSSGWVVAGAIASSYQWGRLHRLCFELNRPLYTPLWGKDQGRVVREEIDAGLDIRVVHLAAEPLTPELIGRRLDRSLLEEIEHRSSTVRKVNVAGEGGEFETLVVDAPFFGSKLHLDETEISTAGGATRWSVRRAHLEPKKGEP